MYITRANNVFNTNKESFNCGGFALGTCNWVLVDGYVYDDDYNSRDEVNEALERETELSIENILSICPKTRVIYKEDELKENEFLVYFRLSSDGDFHFVKRMHNGELWHKMGWLNIERFDEDIYDDWCGRYDGPIVMLALNDEYYR